MTNAPQFHGDTQVRNVAIVVSTLDGPTAERVLDEMPDTLAEAVRNCLPQLGDIPEPERDAALQKFCENATTAAGRPDDTPAATVPSAQQSAMAEPAHAAVTDFVARTDSLAMAESTATRNSADPFDFLSVVDVESLQEALLSERPQVCAVVIRHVPPNCAQQLLAALPAAERLKVVRQLAGMKPVAAEVLTDVADGLRATLQLHRRPEWLELDDPDLAPSFLDMREDEVSRPDIAPDRFSDSPTLSCDERGSAEEELCAVHENTVGENTVREDVADEVVEFHDLLHLPPGSLGGIYGRVAASHWATALMGATSTLRERLLRELSAADAAVLRDEMRHLGPFRLGDVELVQRSIMETLLAGTERSQR